MSGAASPGPISECLGLSLFRLRMRNEWSQREVAEMVSQQGRTMSTFAVMNLERGRRRIDVDDLYAFAKVYRMTPATLISNAIPRQEFR